MCVERTIPEELIIYAEVFDSQRGRARLRRLLARVLSENILSFKYQIPPDFDDLMLAKLKNSSSMRSMLSSILLNSSKDPKSDGKPALSSTHQLQLHESSSSEYADHLDTSTKIRGVAIAPLTNQMYMFTMVGDVRSDFFTLTVRNQTQQRYEFRDKPVLSALFRQHEKCEAEKRAKQRIIELLKGEQEFNEDVFNEI